MVAIFMLILGVSVGYWFANNNRDNALNTDSAATIAPLFYRNPMNPEVTSPIPTDDDMGVRTAMVKKDVLSHIVRAVGRVAYDE